MAGQIGSAREGTGTTRRQSRRQDVLDQRGTELPTRTSRSRSPWSSRRRWTAKELGITDLLRLPLPRFDEGVKIQQVYVRVWVPKDYRLVGDPEGFTSHIGVGLWDSRRITVPPTILTAGSPKTPRRSTSRSAARLTCSVVCPAPAELQIGYWHIPTMTLIASLCVLVVGFVLVPFSLDVKVFTILLAVVAAALASLFSPSIVHSWLLAARLGIAGVVALWLLVWLLFLRRTGYFERTDGQSSRWSRPAAGVSTDVT